MNYTHSPVRGARSRRMRMTYIVTHIVSGGIVTKTFQTQFSNKAGVSAMKKFGILTVTVSFGLKKIIGTGFPRTWSQLCMVRVCTSYKIDEPLYVILLTLSLSLLTLDLFSKYRFQWFKSQNVMTCFSHICRFTNGGHCGLRCPQWNYERGGGEGVRSYVPLCDVGTVLEHHLKRRFCHIRRLTWFTI